MPRRLLVNTQGDIHDNVHDSKCRAGTVLKDVCVGIILRICLSDTWEIFNTKQISFGVEAKRRKL